MHDFILIWCVVNCADKSKPEPEPEPEPEHFRIAAIPLFGKFVHLHFPSIKEHIV